MSTITLPTTKQPATRKSPSMLVIYGPPKCGKTTAVSQLDNCLTIDIEDGSDFLEMLKVKASNYEELRAICKAIKEQNKPYKYIAIDTATRLEEWAEFEATKQYKLSSVGKNFTGDNVLELPNGAGYLWLRNKFLEMQMLLRGCASGGVIFVCHLRDKLIGGKDVKLTTTVSSKDLELTGKCKQIICSQADAIGYVYRKDGKLWINFSTSEEINCGSRCQHLKGVDMELDWKKIYID